jgi:hypothetical protein
VEAWKEACSLRKSGKEPSRVDLASYFASHIEAEAEAAGQPGAGAPAKVVPAAYGGSPGAAAVASAERSKARATKHISFAAHDDFIAPIPAAYTGVPQPQPSREVMDYTVKAGKAPAMQVRCSALWAFKKAESAVASCPHTLHHPSRQHCNSM